MTAQTIRCCYLTAESAVQSYVTSGDIRGGRHGNEASVSKFFSGFTLLTIIPSEVGDNPDHATHYHNLSFFVGGLFLTRNLTG
jgi:hypothetical protein